MGTNIRPEISEKNKYWIEPHKYYELKHFCLQYPSWLKTIDYLNEADGVRAYSYHERGKAFSNPTENFAIRKMDLQLKVDLIDKVLKDIDERFRHYIFLAVTEGYSYIYLKTVMEVPGCKDAFYEQYRKFFWALAQKR